MTRLRWAPEPPIAFAQPLTVVRGSAPAGAVWAAETSSRPISTGSVRPTRRCFGTKPRTCPQAHPPPPNSCPEPAPSPETAAAARSAPAQSAARTQPRHPATAGRALLLHGSCGTTGSANGNRAGKRQLWLLLPPIRNLLFLLGRDTEPRHASPLPTTGPSVPGQRGCSCPGATTEYRTQGDAQHPQEPPHEPRS